LKRERSKPTEAQMFGTFLHSVLEEMHTRAAEAEFVGSWSGPGIGEQIDEIYKQEWIKGALSSVDLFKEGREIIDLWIDTHGEIDSYAVLSNEQQFNIEINGHHVMGYIDRIDRVNDTTVKVVDYKSNRMLYSEHDLTHNLQLSIYSMAARVLYPWAKYVELEFDMLRHGCVQRTTRTLDDLETAADYVEAMAEKALREKEFAPQLNRLCNWCDYRDNCTAYVTAITEAPITIDEREAILVVEKLAGDRRKALDEAIKTRIEMEGPFTNNGKLYELRTKTNRSYKPADTVRVIAEFSPLDPDTVRDKITGVTSTKVNALVKKLKADMPPRDFNMLRAHLEGAVTKRKTKFLKAIDVEE
jgi:CRISPR/Cas system-associated exonuclease Cas4 (RecB family)